MITRTIERIPTRRYSLGSSVALWRKTTSTGKRYYVVGPKEAPPKFGWLRTMKAAVQVHREGKRPRRMPQDKRSRGAAPIPLPEIPNGSSLPNNWISGSPHTAGVLESMYEVFPGLAHAWKTIRTQAPGPSHVTLTRDEWRLYGGSSSRSPSG